MEKEYKYVIIYQWFDWFGKCHFDFVRGKTLESAKEVLGERRRKYNGHNDFQELIIAKEIDPNQPLTNRK